MLSGFFATSNPSKGGLSFHHNLADTITNLKIESYPLLYANENAIGAMLFKGFMSDDDLKKLNAALESASPAERGGFLNEFASSLCEGIGHIEIPKTPAELAVTRQKFLSLPEDGIKSRTRRPPLP